MTSILFKILRPDEWKEFERLNVFYGSSDDQTDGFIHLSTAKQLNDTLAKHFAKETDIGLLLVNAKKLGDDLKWEPSSSGELFPHLYGPLIRRVIVTKYAPPLSKKQIKSIAEHFS